MTYRELYEYGVAELEKAGIAEAKLDARLLLEYICHTDRNTLLVHGDSQRNGLEEQFYRMIIEKRALHIPLQHLTGEQEFMGLTFKVNEHTLIPRQDTEFLVEEVMRHLADGMTILDMCTGSGCILLSLLKYSNECEGTGVDISPKALEVARENATLLGIKAHFLEGDLFSPLEKGETFDIIVSNPPYIETEVIKTLMPEVRDYEPVSALDGSEDGLLFYRKIIEEAYDRIRSNGWLFFEIGHNQGDAVSALMKERGFLEVEVLQDYSGNNRVVYGKKR